MYQVRLRVIILAKRVCANGGKTLNLANVACSASLNRLLKPFMTDCITSSIFLLYFELSSLTNGVYD